MGKILRHSVSYILVAQKLVISKTTTKVYSNAYGNVGVVYPVVVGYTSTLGNRDVTISPRLVYNCLLRALADTLYWP